MQTKEHEGELVRPCPLAGVHSHVATLRYSQHLHHMFVCLHGQMERIEEITSDEPFLLVPTVRSSSPFPLQIVNLKYIKVHMYKLCKLVSVSLPIVSGCWSVNSCHSITRINKVNSEPLTLLLQPVVLPFSPQGGDEVEDVGGIPSFLSGRKCTTCVHVLVTPSLLLFSLCSIGS